MEGHSLDRDGVGHALAGETSRGGGDEELIWQRRGLVLHRPAAAQQQPLAQLRVLASSCAPQPTTLTLQAMPSLCRCTVEEFRVLPLLPLGGSPGPGGEGAVAALELGLQRLHTVHEPSVGGHGSRVLQEPGRHQVGQPKQARRAGTKNGTVLAGAVLAATEEGSAVTSAASP